MMNSRLDRSEKVKGLRDSVGMFNLERKKLMDVAGLEDIPEWLSEAAEEEAGRVMESVAWVERGIKDLGG